MDKGKEIRSTRAGDDKLFMSETEEAVDWGFDPFSGREVEFWEFSVKGTIAGDVCTGEENCI